MTWWSRFVGLPFGDGPGRVHCWGLVRRVYAEELGVDLPAYGEITSAELVRVAREIGRGQEAWERVAFPRAFDVAVMALPGRDWPGHVGVMVDEARVLHVEAASAAVVVPVTHFSVAARIRSFRRWMG